MNQAICDSCQNQLQYPDEIAGKKVRCPKCKNVVSLPVRVNPKTSLASQNLTAPTPPPAKKTKQQTPQPRPIQAQPIQAQPIQAQPIQAQPIQAQPIQAQPIQAQPFAQPQGQPLDDPLTGFQQPLGTGLPMSPSQPAWQQPTRRKGNSKALKTGLLWGGVGGGVVLLIILLLVFKPWAMFGGPKAAFSRFQNGIANGNFVVLYDVMSEEAKTEFDRNLSVMLAIDPTGQFSDLKSLSGRQRFAKFIQLGKDMAKKNGIAPKTLLTDAQRDDILKTKITKVEYSENGESAILTLEGPNTGKESMTWIKESGGWKLSLQGQKGMPKLW